METFLVFFSDFPLSRLGNDNSAVRGAVNSKDVRFNKT
jgi:hypothetical protein